MKIFLWLFLFLTFFVNGGCAIVATGIVAGAAMKYMEEKDISVGDMMPNLYPSSKDAPKKDVHSAQKGKRKK